MKYPVDFGRRPFRRRQGFALLITVTLLAFLVLLLVTLSSLTRVETQVTNNSQTMVVARENALMALNIAIGQLQKYAGPDQAVSARADIASTGSVNQPYLTGIWNGNVTTASATPKVWLVSGNELSPLANTPSSLPASPTNAPAQPYSDTAGTVLLVGASSAATDPLLPANSPYVQLPKQTITAPAGAVPGLGASAAPSVGHYAYWVGDEGIKASASLIDPLLGTNPISYNNSSSSPSYNNASGGATLGDDWSNTVTRSVLEQTQLTRPQTQQIFPTLNPDAGGDLSGLPNIVDLPQLALLSANAPISTALQAQFHNVTSLSQAVLTDVPDGRLKLDLSASNANTVTGFPAAILAFLSTRPTVSSVGNQTTTYGPMPASASTASTYPAYSIGPVIYEMGIRFNFYLVSGVVNYTYTIEAGIWNPYGSTLNISPSVEPLTVTISGLPAMTITTDGSTHVTWTPPTITATINGNNTSPTLGAGFRAWFAGGSDLEEIPVSGTPPAITVVTEPVPGATSDPTATIVTVAYQAVPVSQMQVVLNADNKPISTYQPSISFSDGSVSNTTNSSSGYMLGYGWQFANSLAGVTNGAQSGAYDIRLPLLTGTFADNTDSGDWQADPSQNINGVGNSGYSYYLSLNTGNNAPPNIALFDLPRQEVTSLGMLTHVIGSQPYTVGSSWGGTANAIFDQYYLSSVPQYATTWTGESGLPLPNRYVSVYHPAGTSTIPLSGSPSIRDVNDAPYYLLQTGAFNINSTSVATWEAMLGSNFTSSNPWKSSRATTGITLTNTFFLLPHAAQELPEPWTANAAADGTTNQTTEFTSGRQLTADELTSFATQMVAQIKTYCSTHGPFVSLQNFINSGVILSAINSAELNAGLGGSGATLGNEYAPGALTQAAVINEIAPLMTPRSDTFRIRTYGDMQNPVTGAITGRAWCEAVVQRVPDLVPSPSNPSATPSMSDIIAPSASTYPFGRRFKIVSFRWLSSSDI